MTRVFVVALLVLAAVSLPAQNQPTFRTGANYVRVDMYATRDGKPIEDLKVDEIDILEDGVLQKIDAFEHVRVRTVSQESVVEPKGIQESREMAANPRAAETAPPPQRNRRQRSAGVAFRKCPPGKCE